MEVCGWYDSPLRSIVLYPNTFIYCKRWGSHRMQHHQYVCAALEFVVSGSATFLLDGKKTKVSAGEIFIMQRGCDSGFTTSADEYYEKMTLCISGTILDLLVESLHLNAVPKITLSHVEEAKRRFREIERLLREKVPGTERLLTEKTFNLFLFLEEENRETRNRTYPRPLRKALEFLHGNYTRGHFGMGAVAEVAGVSTPTLIRMFRTCLGKSPMEHVTEMRMELAKTLLESTGLPVKEIAERVGYNDPLYFSNAFRNYVGISPRAYRASVGNGRSPAPGGESGTDAHSSSEASFAAPVAASSRSSRKRSGR